MSENWRKAEKVTGEKFRCMGCFVDSSKKIVKTEFSLDFCEEQVWQIVTYYCCNCESRGKSYHTIGWNRDNLSIEEVENIVEYK